MLLNIVQRTGQTPTTKKDPVQNVTGARVEEPCTGARVDHLCIGQGSNCLNLCCLMELALIREMFSICAVQYVSQETHEVI